MKAEFAMNENSHPQEIDKFTKLAEKWWDQQGPLYTLHAVNPLRVQWILNYADLTDKTILDIGCGGGILTEALSQFSPHVMGIDLAEDCLKVATEHSKHLATPPEYKKISAENLAKEKPGVFDVITCLECLEHVPDPSAILQACALMLKPGGKLFLSTLNRNPKSFLHAIVGAEYVLNMIPKGTHQYKDFIRPSELIAWMKDLPLSLQAMKGITYNPGTKQFLLTDDVSVNYLMYCQKSA